MRLWQEIVSQLGDGQPPAGDAAGVIYTVWEGKGGYFQNVKSLTAFSPTEILLRLRRGELCVSGEGLTVAKYCESDVFIRGKIVGVQRKEGG